MRKILILLLLITMACSKEKTEKRAVFFEVAGPSKYSVKVTNETNGISYYDTVEQGWNLTQNVEVGNFTAIEVIKIVDTSIYSVDFVRMYVYGVKHEAVDSGFKNTMSLSSKVQ